MNSCSNCQIDLCVDFVPASCSYQCSRCGHYNRIFEDGKESKLSKTAWLSLLLGVTAAVNIVIDIVLIFLGFRSLGAWLSVVSFALGLISCYCGIKAMLRSRYEFLSQRATWFASIGVGLGSSFGVGLGGIGTVLIAVVIFIQAMTSEATDPNDAAEIWRQHGNICIDNDPSWFFVKSSLSPLRNQVEFCNNLKFSSSDARFCVGWANQFLTSQPGSAALARRQLQENNQNRTLGDLKTDKRLGAPETLEWEIAEQAVSVAKQEWSVSNQSPDSQIERIVIYNCLFDRDELTWCLTFCHHQPSSKLVESEIQEIFQSFQPK